MSEAATSGMQRRASRTISRARPGSVIGVEVEALPGSMPEMYTADDFVAIAAWARAPGAAVLLRPGRGLNGAVADGVEHLAGEGFDQVIVAHADLPLATTLGWLADFDGVTLVPDRHDDGTNVACVPAAAGFTFAYGAGSFARHCAEAERLGLALRIERDVPLGWDVDVPADLTVLSQ